MGEEIKNSILSDAELEKVNGGYEEYELQEMICEFGHVWGINLDVLWHNPEEAFTCPIYGSTDVRRKE